MRTEVMTGKMRQSKEEAKTIDRQQDLGTSKRGDTGSYLALSELGEIMAWIAGHESAG